MLSTYWKAKSDGYELVDGSNHSSASSRSSSPSLDHHYLHHPFDIPARRSKSTSLTSQTLCILRRNRRRVTLIFLAIVVIYIFESILGVILSPPAYVVLPPDRYVQTLEASLQDRMQLPSTEARKSILANIKELGIPSSIDYHRSEGLPPITSIPNNLFSSDQYEQPSEWAPMWKEKGFEAHFYNDSQANTWVEREWNGTDIIEAWRKMPRSILRADMLRYLLLLIEGGTWSDMDTVPVMHLSNWTMDAIPFRHRHIDRLQQSPSPAAAIQRFKERSMNQTTAESPIRAIISLECVPRWYSLRGALELLRLKPLNRHRNLQYVQWTIHIAPHHPILIDVLRRILETMDLHRAYTVEAEREDQRANWGWKEDRAGPTGSLLLPSKSPNQNKAFPATSAPWESIGQQWVYTRGHWRLGWHPTSVEEWTGPGVWTDSVVSYIYATTGIRPERLANIKRPTLIGDLLILPEYGFNPPKSSASHPYSVSRVVHLFRGSWKQSIRKAS